MEEAVQPRTIREIADLLGISSMTVHRALSGKPDVAPKTRDRVLAEVERLGYRPNLAARGLRQGKTFTLGIVVSDVAASFLPEVLQGVERAAEERGYHSIVCVHEHQPLRAERHLLNLQSKGVDGLVYYPTETGEELEILNAVLRSTPVAVIMREAPGFLGSSVLVDDRKGGELATRHLLELGHRRIGFLGYSHSGFSRSRQKGYEDAVALTGLDGLCAVAKRHGEAQQAILTLLHRPDRPTALFCASDRLAARVLQESAALGISVPKELSVVGYNGDPWVDLLRVPLTTVVQPRLEVGSRAARLVLDPETPDAAPGRLMLDPWLVVQQSTAPPR